MAGWAFAYFYQLRSFYSENYQYLVLVYHSLYGVRVMSPFI